MARLAQGTTPRTGGLVAALSEDQRKYLEGRLREERGRALATLRRYDEARQASREEAGGDLSRFPFHPADQGTDSMDQEIAARLAERASRELAEIDAALQRLYEHPERFGLSETTGQPIPFERLDLLPWARTGAEPA
jgi:RNA polymerase-binding transcription factor DksA